MRGNVYRQLPLYCFLEEEATSVPQREDPETYEKLVESNAKYLADMMKEEIFSRAVMICGKIRKRLLKKKKQTGSTPVRK